MHKRHQVISELVEAMKKRAGILQSIRATIHFAPDAPLDMALIIKILEKESEINGAVGK